MKEKIERQLVENSYSTAADFGIVAYFIKFPNSVAGLRMLDIGSGASTAVLDLRKMGARAFGIDVRYRDLDELRDSLERFFADPTYSARQENERRDEKFFAALQKDTSPGVNPQLWKMAVQMTRVRRGQSHELYFANQRQQVKAFFSPASEKPYIAGSAHYCHFEIEVLTLCILYKLLPSS